MRLQIYKQRYWYSCIRFKYGGYTLRGFSIPGDSGMDFLIPGHPRRPEMTINVLYCSDVTVTVVELSAANYLNHMCTIDRPIG